MADHSQYQYLTTELDPDILSTPFNVQTNWHVVTGAPASGKTTIIDHLTAKGFKTVPEVARQVFEEELAKGRTLEEIRSDGIAHQHRIMERHLKVEGDLNPDDNLFLDRGLPECITFCRVFGMNPNEILRECFRNKYASVFMLDPLPNLREIKLGPEDETTAIFLNEWHVRDYRAVGYDVVRVPVLPVEERVAFILENLLEQGLM
jgi:predicted ATPase